MVVSGFVEPITKELPLEYAVEMNRLIQLQMEGSVGYAQTTRQERAGETPPSRAIRRCPSRHDRGGAGASRICAASIRTLSTPSGGRGRRSRRVDARARRRRLGRRSARGRASTSRRRPRASRFEPLDENDHALLHARRLGREVRGAQRRALEERPAGPRAEGRRAREAALRPHRNSVDGRLDLLAPARRRRGGLALHADRGVRLGCARPARRTRTPWPSSSSSRRAKLEYVSIQNLSRETWHFATHHARVERDAELDWVAGGFGSKNGKTRIQNDLNGPGATSRVTGAYFADGEQHLDYDTFQEHIAPSTESDFAFKGALREKATAVWRGMIRVEPDAQKTNAYQENRNLLLSPDAHADSIPGPRDHGQRRALHARRDARPGQPRASSST